MHPPIDRISEEELARLVPKSVATLTLEDIVRLSKEGNSADQIIDSIKASDSLYDITPSQSIALSQQGVDKKVLDYIHTSRELAWRNNVADEINKREKIKREELDKLKRQQFQQGLMLNHHCFGHFGMHPFGHFGMHPFGHFGMHPFGYGAFGPRFGPRFGIGAGHPWGWGCW